MEEEIIIEMMERIRDYIHGRLCPKEEDTLWVEFLKDPHWYNIFETELHFTNIAKNAGKDFESYLPVEG